MLLIRKTRVETSPNGKGKYRYGLFECPSCKKTVELHIQNGKRNKQCRRCASTKHGMCTTRQYHAWQHMIARTTNPNDSRYEFYKDKVPPRKWFTFEGFWEDMKDGYQDGLKIDRIDNDKPYSKENCRWVNQSIQSQNTRVIRKNNTTGFRGVTLDKGKYSARCQIDGKMYWLGYYKTADEAANAYDNFVILNKTEHNINDPKRRYNG